jgi:glycerol-3-phosphate dehydrogenase (NAD(P)+)|tara:strand:- start:294 stop:1247 length:954 start_codon:yes stop_codon:yes gene_type:complete
MSKIVIIGAGAMGTAFSFPCVDNDHDVSIIGSPLENSVIDNLKKNNFHKDLDCTISKNINFLRSDNLNDQLKNKPDLIVIGVNSKGIDWVAKEIQDATNLKTPLLMLTKGLTIQNNKFTILTEKFKNSEITAVAGPCLAKDLSKKNNTTVVFANKNLDKAKSIIKLIKTNYYYIESSDDLLGIEICAAIKNFYSMIIGSVSELNSAAFLLHKSIIEMSKFVKILGGSENSVYGLAGLGDLYVSSAGGRNSKMGHFLGKGYLYSEAKSKFMSNETIEGAELAMEIGKKVLKDFSEKDFPLMFSLIDAICNNKKFTIKW